MVFVDFVYSVGFVCVLKVGLLHYIRIGEGKKDIFFKLNFKIIILFYS